MSEPQNIEAEVAKAKASALDSLNQATPQFSKHRAPGKISVEDSSSGGGFHRNPDPSESRSNSMSFKAAPPAIDSEDGGGPSNPSSGGLPTGGVWREFTTCEGGTITVLCREE
jgi:hypothetical protein